MKNQLPILWALGINHQHKIPFEFSVRVPDWATTSSNSVFHSFKQLLNPLERLQTFPITPDTTKLEFNLDMQPTASPRNGTTAVYYGPLLYALDIAETTSSYSPVMVAANPY